MALIGAQLWRAGHDRFGDDKVTEHCTRDPVRHEPSVKRCQSSCWWRCGSGDSTVEADCSYLSRTHLCTTRTHDMQVCTHHTHHTYARTACTYMYHMLCTHASTNPSQPRFVQHVGWLEVRATCRRTHTRVLGSAIIASSVLNELQLLE